MLRPIFVVICSLSLHSCKTVATTNSFKSIYGEDGRQEVYDHANTPLAQLATSTAMKIGSRSKRKHGVSTKKYVLTSVLQSSSHQAPVAVFSLHPTSLQPQATASKA
jgi:hypothetical protein